MSSVCISDLKLSYKSHKKKKASVIVDIDKPDNKEISVDSAEIVGFFGPNHVGKSTLLRYIAQVHTGLHVSRSNITYDGTKYDMKNHSPLISYVPQDYASSLFPWFSIKENLRILLRSLNYSGSKIGSKTQDFFEQFGFESEEAFFTHYGLFKNGKARKIRELSGGQQQILVVIRALLIVPNIIAMDEPFSALDFFSRGNDFRNKVFAYLRKKKITTFIVSHTLEEIVSLTDKVYIFNYDELGKILVCEKNVQGGSGAINDLIKDIKEEYTLR